jgi:hypothetical protein
MPETTRGGLSPYLYGGPGQKSPEDSAFNQITGLCPCQLQATKATRLAGQRVVQGMIPIYSGSQRVCTILIRRFSVPSASEALSLRLAPKPPLQGPPTSLLLLAPALFTALYNIYLPCSANHIPWNIPLLV